MLKPPKELADLAKKQTENSLRFAELSLQSTERLVRLQMEAARRAFEENAEIAKVLSETTDPQQLAELRAKLAKKNTEALLSYSKEVYETAVQSRTQLMEVLNQSLGASGKLPGAGESPWGAWSAVMTAANGAAENLFKLATQATTAAASASSGKIDPKSTSPKKS
jgi:phasin family protein